MWDAAWSVGGGARKIVAALVVLGIAVHVSGCCGKAKAPLLIDADVVGLYTITYQDLAGTLRIRSDGTYCQTMKDRETGAAAHSGGWERWHISSREPQGLMGTVPSYKIILDNCWGFYEVPGFPRQVYASHQFMLEKWPGDEIRIIVGNRHFDFWKKVSNDPEAPVP